MGVRNRSSAEFSRENSSAFVGSRMTAETRVREAACSLRRVASLGLYDALSVTMATKGASPPPPHLVSGFLKFRGGFTAPLEAQKGHVSPFELLDSEEQFFTALSPRGSSGNPSGNFRRSWILTNLASSSGTGSSRMCNSNLCSFRENSRGKY